MYGDNWYRMWYGLSTGVWAMNVHAVYCWNGFLCWTMDGVITWSSISSFVLLWIIAHGGEHVVMLAWILPGDVLSVYLSGVLKAMSLTTWQGVLEGVSLSSNSGFAGGDPRGSVLTETTSLHLYTLLSDSDSLEPLIMALMLVVSFFS